MQDVWGVLLIALGGLLVGGAISTWRTNARLIALILGLGAVLAVAAGVLRLGYAG